VDDAIANGEKLYTLKDIQKASAEEFNMTKEDFKLFIQGLKEGQKTIEKLRKDYADDDRQLKKLDRLEEEKFAKSEIYFSSHDGHVSTHSVPCNDDNGWGYENFFYSDCYFALAITKACMTDLLDHAIGYQARYCKPTEKKNCSPLIFHTKGHHHYFYTTDHTDKAAWSY
jgi:hypothetical protein